MNLLEFKLLWTFLLNAQCSRMWRLDPTLLGLRTFYVSTCTTCIETRSSGKSLRDTFLTASILNHLTTWLLQEKRDTLWLLLPSLVARESALEKLLPKLCLGWLVHLWLDPLILSTMERIRSLKYFLFRLKRLKYSWISKSMTTTDSYSNLDFLNTFFPIDS